MLGASPPPRHSASTTYARQAEDANAVKENGDECRAFAGWALTTGLAAAWRRAPRLGGVLPGAGPRTRLGAGEDLGGGGGDLLGLIAGLTGEERFGAFGGLADFCGEEVEGGGIGGGQKGGWAGGDVRAGGRGGSTGGGYGGR